jgi:hypothetical protein
MEPITLQGPGLSAPPPIRAPDLSQQQRVAQGLAEWGGAKIAEAVNIQQEKDILAGQMAYTQGQALEDIGMAGNKWALDGYRLVDAQTVSSSFLAAQREQIAQGDYQLDPDGYRDQYVSRLEGALQGVDPDTARLIREQMAGQMPTLVVDHTTAHLRWKEQENFDALERGIDVISRDPTATDALVLFAQGGEDSPTAGLSDNRRQAATVSGVVRAFDNDNPLAYAALVKEGLLGDNLTTDEQNKIKAAQERFMTRRKTEYNADLFNGEQALMKSVEMGELTPDEAVEELSILWADHGIKMDKADAGAIYADAEHGQNVGRQTRGLLIEEAGLRGDRAAQANIIMDSLIGTESGGNASAHRTNQDGRSFGGLVQMGQARLDEVTHMMGIPNLTVSEYTAMSAADQKKIAQRHFVDLIEAAEATGAIGTTINGVTVTLSGLVAVGHLGGKGGMRQFVESGGAYNPADELGTSLTDYLSKHGSGEMQEYMGADERYNRAKALRDEAYERNALAAYAATEPGLYDVDGRFIRGEIGRSQWQSERRDLYSQYGRALTEADVKHEVATIKKAEDYSLDAAKKSGDETYRLQVEAAEASLSVPRLAWEEVLNNPASTNEQIAAANAAYVDARKSIFDDAGIRLIDRKDGAAAEEMVVKTRAAMERGRIYREENVEIEAAIAAGAVGDLPKALQDRAFKMIQENTAKPYNEAVAKGAMSEDAANTLMGRDMNVNYAQMGVVDPKVSRYANATMRQSLVDKDGNPSPRIVDVVTQYGELKALNPRAADTMLTGAERGTAEAILARTGGDPALIADAVRDVGLESPDNPFAGKVDEFMTRPDVQAGIDAATEDYLNSQDINWLHAIWQDDALYDQTDDRGYVATDRMWAEENKGRVRDEIATELSRLKRQTPHHKDADLVARAAENVERRTAIIGGDPVILQADGDIGKLFFGNRAVEFRHDSDVNSAVMHWLRSPEVQEQYPFVSGTTFAENLPQWMQSSIDAIPFVDFAPAMSYREARDSRRGEVRPFRAFPSGKDQIAIQVLMPDGNYSDEIVLPTQEIGKLYMAKRKGEFTKKPGGQVLPSLGGFGGIPGQ